MKWLWNKYRLNLDFSDFYINIENTITINIKGLIVVDLSKKRYVGLGKKTLNSLKSFVYADLAIIIINNYKDVDKIKKLLIEHLTNLETKDYKIVKFRIDDVYNVKKRERKLKLEKINKLS